MKDGTMPNLSKYLFWDIDITKLDYDKRASFILERVFTMGMQEDEWEVNKYYGKERIRREVIKSKALDKKTLNYLSIFYEIPKEDFACYTNVVIEGIKVDFVHHPFELVKPVYHNKQISYLGKKDIAAMKLHAIETSGDKAKDFVDIYFLLKEISLEEMFESYRIKYSTDNIFNAKRSLGFFEDVLEESWNEVHFIGQKVGASIIKSAILNEINKFNEKNIQ